MSEFTTVTDVVEHTFCQKFTYFGHVLGLKQFEEKRGTVQSGRTIHKIRQQRNTSYVPTWATGRKISDMTLYSQKNRLVGKIDEAIETEKEIILIEYKYSDYAILTKTHKVQMGLLSILLEENLKKPVNKGVVVFLKDGRHEVPIEINHEIKKIALDSLMEFRLIIRSGESPKSVFDGRCLNCCYRNICPVASLKENQ